MFLSDTVSAGRQDMSAEDCQDESGIKQFQKTTEGLATAFLNMMYS